MRRMISFTPVAHGEFSEDDNRFYLNHGIEAKGFYLIKFYNDDKFYIGCIFIEMTDEAYSDMAYTKKILSFDCTAAEEDAFIPNPYIEVYGLAEEEEEDPHFYEGYTCEILRIA